MTSPFRTAINFAGLIVVGTLAGCGGGDGSTTSSPTPVASSTPTPATPVASPSPFTFSLVASPFRLGQTSAFTYTVLGIRATSKSGAWENIGDPASGRIASDLGVRLASASDMYFRFAEYGEGRLSTNGGGGYSPDGKITQLSFNALGGGGSLYHVYDKGASPLRYTAAVYWQITARPDGEYPYDDFVALYGVGTQSADVPTSGKAVYGGGLPGYEITVDFASGTLSGSSRDENGVEFSSLRDVRIGPDRTSFSGKVIASDSGEEGTVEGRFTGPAAAELMMRTDAVKNGLPALSLTGVARGEITPL